MKVSIIKEPEFYKSVIRIMLPVALQQAINMGVNMMDTMMLGSFGEIQLSASSLANQYYNFFTILCMGIIRGLQRPGGPVLGSRRKEKVKGNVQYGASAFCGCGGAVYDPDLDLSRTDHVHIYIGRGGHRPGNPLSEDNGIYFCHSWDQSCGGPADAFRGTGSSGAYCVHHILCGQYRSQLYFHFWKIWNAQNGDCRSGAGNAHCQRSGVYYHLFLYPCEG